MPDLFNHEYEVWLQTELDDTKFCYQFINHNYNKIYDILGFLKWKQ